MRRTVRPIDFLRDTSGAASIEFAIVAVALFAMIFTVFESGVMMVRSVMLERGLSIAARDIRLGEVSDTDRAFVKQRICDGAFLIADCESSVRVQAQAFANAGAYNTGNPVLLPVECVDREAEPPTEEEVADDTLGIGVPDSIVFVRACLLVRPFFPGLGLGYSLARTLNGEYAIVKATAFMREPS